MRNHIITATEAARAFSTLLNKVHYQGESFAIQRGKNIVAKIIPSTTAVTLRTKELKEFFNHLPRLNEDELESFAQDIEMIREQQLPKNPWD